MLPAIERDRTEHARVAKRIRSQITVRGWPVSELHFDIYALSRLHDLILCHLVPDTLPRQPEGWFRNGPTQTIDTEDHARLIAALGFETLTEENFTPVLHEIVAVEEAADPDTPIEITQTFWPCVTIGKLLFARAGVALRAGRNMLPAQAQSTPLFWAYARCNRPSADLSNGWGSNSQWSTLPRVDVIEDSAIHLNLNTSEPRFPESEQDSNLLVHRCPLTSGSTADEHWPFDLTGTYIRRTGTLVPYAP